MFIDILGLFKTTFTFDAQEAARRTHLVHDMIPRHWDWRIATWMESGIRSDAH